VSEDFVSSYEKPEVLAATRDAASRLLKEIKPAIPLKTVQHMPTMANHAYDAIEEALVTTGAAIANARGTGKAIGENRDWQPEGRRDRIGILSEKTEEKVASGVTILHNATEALVAELESAAMPKAPEKPDQISLARDNALAVLDRAKGDAKRDAYLRLASRNDQTAALLMGDLGREISSVIFGESLGEALWNQARVTHLAEAVNRKEPSAVAAQAARKMAGIAAGLVMAWDNEKYNLSRAVRG
jgi:hypothetical protein